MAFVYLTVLKDAFFNSMSHTIFSLAFIQISFRKNKSFGIGNLAVLPLPGKSNFKLQSERAQTVPVVFSLAAVVSLAISVDASALAVLNAAPPLAFVCVPAEKLIPANAFDFIVLPVAFVGFAVG